MSSHTRIVPLRILVACEASGRVREAFRKLGHNAWSCDILPSDDNSSYHIQDDVLKHLNDGWDMMIAHPPCTYLSYVGNRHWNKPGRAEKREEAMQFFMALVNAPIDKICVENPLGEPSRAWRKYDQIIQPYYWGDPYQKRTCLWLKNLPPLVWDKEKAVKPEPLFYLSTTGKPINWVEGLSGMSKKDRQKARNTTFQGIANAMAEQWQSNGRAMGETMIVQDKNTCYDGIVTKRMVGWMLFAGLLIGWFFGSREVWECPREILGYNCHMGSYGECDHRKSTMYSAKMTMALNEEARHDGR